MRQDTRARWELTHLVNVFFCTASRSSGEIKQQTLNGEEQRVSREGQILTLIILANNRI